MSILAPYLCSIPDLYLALMYPEEYRPIRFAGNNQSVIAGNLKVRAKEPVSVRTPRSEISIGVFGGKRQISRSACTRASERISEKDHRVFCVNSECSQ